MQMMHNWSVLPMNVMNHIHLFQDGADSASLAVVVQGMLAICIGALNNDQTTVVLHNEQLKRHPLARSNLRTVFDSFISQSSEFYKCILEVKLIRWALFLPMCCDENKFFLTMVC